MGLRRIVLALWRSTLSIAEIFLLSLPNTNRFSGWRNWYWRQRGFRVAKDCFIAKNVTFAGIVTIGEGSLIADNCILNGSNAGIFVGKKVMIAPNCVLVAFNHSFQRIDIPMIDQPLETAPIIIEDDVWIAANCTIAKGVRLGRGCIVSANSQVRNNVEPYSAVRGVPAKAVGSRLESA
jgi:acetyltransferase-like isoleucine patch superfamily enzyme